MNLYVSEVNKGNKYPHSDLNLNTPTSKLKSDVAAKQIMKTILSFPSCLDIGIEDKELWVC